MIIENKSLSAEALKDFRLAAVAQLAEEELRNKTKRMIYHIIDSRYLEMMKFAITLRRRNSDTDSN